MTPDELIAALAPSRLPPGLMALDWRGMLALAGLGLLAGLALALALSPLLSRRPSRRARIRATRGLPGAERLLAIARILGRLPAALRAPAYGAAPMPPQDEVERLARRRR
ncbi:hypothetical protein SAMN05421641_11710 [Paracoccus thiocyanatus]|uniref:Uncharacterized protein n=1 Tax=Paracoccus thiocyanatus TaxID=34006 RepID=A0A1N6WIL2_9RHOB|nr:hypothetical protein [Paracoccus thiocyanatus]SIQ90007.1 hypothetical protein SAMN05421641_11710 [Paracoccus thiocyanatus]